MLSWSPVATNFTLFCVLYIPINIFELYLGIQFKYKKIVWSFLVLFSRLVRQGQSSVYPKANYFPQ